MIYIESLTKTFSSGNGIVTALNNVSLKIEKGDVFGLIGQSGAGKSSLIRSLALLSTPTSGTIFFDGRNIALNKGLELRNFRKKIGMIFQHFNLLSSRTVGENIAFPLELAGTSQDKIDTRVDELLELVGLKAKKNAYPSTLSGGEKQRVGIARALATEPELLLCDEATSALDPKTTKEILDLLKKINQTLGLTIFLITHQMEVIRRICNKVAVMDKGAIIEQGVVSEVFYNPKQLLTKELLQNATHELPEEFFKESSPNHKLLRLSFRGDVAGEPIISRLIQNFGVEANILLGWVDHFQTTIIGNLIIELNGSEEGISQSLGYLKLQNIAYEVLEK